MRLVDEIVDLERDIKKLSDEIVTMKREVRLRIQHLPTKYKLLMNLRYIECLEWDGVSEAIECSLSHTHKLHGQALKMVDQ